MVVFAGFLKIISPGVGFKHDFSGWGFRTFFLPGGWRIHPFKKNPPGMVRLGIDPVSGAY